MRDKRTWMKVEGFYRCVKLYNVIFRNWSGSVIVLAIFSGSACITAALYMTCRPSGLPVFIYCVFPIAAMAALFAIYRICYDAVMAKRTGDEVLGNLQSRTAGYFYGLELAEKKEMMRRAKALQPVRIAMGGFAEITMEITVGIWDEILNQLLFLLSL